MQSIIGNSLRVSNEDRHKQIASNSHYIDFLLLLITYLGMTSCLVRADFNFVIALFAYFVKQQKWSSLIVKLEIALFLVSFIFDIVYALLEIRVWYQTDEYQPIWQTIYPMHLFATATFIIELILKIVVFVLLFQAKSIMVK